MSEPVPPTAAPRGWYADPQTPGRERWWTGTEWSRYSHRLPLLPETFGRAYTRAFWAGPNRAARLGANLGIAAWVCLFSGYLVGVVDRGGIPPTLYLVLAVIILVTAASAIVFAAVGLRRAAELGALGLSIWTMVIASISLIGPVIIFALILASGMR